MTPSIRCGVLFCYRQPKAAGKAIESFLAIYEESRVLCVIDAGGLLPEVPPRFADRVTVVWSASRLSAKRDGLYLNSSSAKKYLEYLLLGLDLAGEGDWIFLLEDDVECLAPVSSLLFDLNGTNERERLKKPLRFWVWLMGGSYESTRGFGGCGGSILRTSALRQAVAKDYWKVRLFIGISRSVLGSDELLSFLFSIGRQSIGNYDGFVEAWQSDFDEKLNSKAIRTLHKKRDHYL